MSELPVSKWYGYKNESTVADAIMNLITVIEHRIELELK